MKAPMTAAEVHKQYDEGMLAFKKYIGDPTLRVIMNQSVDSFMRFCAKGVWKEELGISPRHVEYYNALYCRGNSVPTVLYWELARQVDEFSGFRIPEFFRRLTEYDLEKKETVSRRFVDLFVLMMLMAAAVDNIVSEKEATFINRCADAMNEYCDRVGVQGGGTSLKTEEFVTRSAIDAVEKKGERVSNAENEGQMASKASEQTDEAKEEQTLDELLDELDSLCGLEKVKEDVKSLINLVKVRKLRKEAGLPFPPVSLHLVFMGNPGTGKTTVARLLAKIYHAVGVLTKGQLIEVDRSGLVAGFVGQTAIKTSEVIGKALGGVLFIDEAYALTNNGNPNDFGQEAIETILKAMEDHREDLIVIVAGYTDLMQQFIDSNPGLESRFNKFFYFDDYTGEQLAEIFKSMCTKNGYSTNEEIDTTLRYNFLKLYAERDENFGNARDVRNIFEKAVSKQADRIAGMQKPSKEDLMAFAMEDFDF